MKLMQQERAHFALRRVKKAKKDANINAKEYISYASSLPAMIHTNGLGQAAAFFKSKGKTHNALYDLLSDWLRQQNQPFEGKELLDGITSADMKIYRLAQAEAQTLMDWVKKFAKAYMKEDKPAQAKDQI